MTNRERERERKVEISDQYTPHGHFLAQFFKYEEPKSATGKNLAQEIGPPNRKLEII